jgi:hypothetical protein
MFGFTTVKGIRSVKRKDFVTYNQTGSMLSGGSGSSGNSGGIQSMLSGLGGLNRDHELVRHVQ